YNVKDPKYGAKGDGITDDFSAFYHAVSDGKFIYVPEGIYRLSGTLNIPANKTLMIAPGATLVRVAKDDSTDPVVRLTGNNANLLGQGIVKSEKNHPKGVV